MKLLVKMLYYSMIILLTLGFAISFLLLLNGSLEMYPTPEQIEKTRIVAILLMILFGGSVGTLIIGKRIYHRNNTQQKEKTL